MLTLREGLQLAEPLRRARVLAGEGGLDRVVESVNVMEVPDILEWVRPGELLVTTLYPLRDNPEALAELVPQLAAKGLVGLAITPGSYVDRIPPEMIEVADRLDFPLIELPPKVSFIDIIQPLTSRILHIQASELRQSESLLRRFLDLVLRGGSFAEIARLIAEAVGHPVAVIDRFRRVLGQSAPFGEGEILVRDPSGDLYLREDLPPAAPAELGWEGAEVWEVAGPRGRQTIVAHPIHASTMALGYILVGGALSPSVPYAVRVALDHGATVAALKMMELRALSQVEQQFQHEVLEALLAPGAGARAVNLARQMGLSLDPPFYVVVAAPDLPLGEVLAHGEDRSRSAIDTSLHLARRYVRTLNPRAVFWRLGTRLVALFPVGGLRTDRAAIAQALREVCQRVGTENPPHSVSMGVGPLTTTVEGFAEGYRAAMQSLELGRLVQPKGKGTVTCYEELGLFRLLSGVQSREDLASFCRESLGPVLRAKRSAALLGTLRAYLEHGQNLRQTAHALGIHYNTARYRLRRLQELLGPALEDPSTRLALEISLHLLPLAFPEVVTK
ncbi:MAG: PucR family transcriptional regulator ligand-binding domain-containing protein [Candidatus Acetothermia bacterium]|jgi:purine catabolism regulator|nr:PucR family transcriptional regulator ligand-binding domain-containing protein [Candidatus Acetothermia bacterium]